VSYTVNNTSPTVGTSIRFTVTIDNTTTRALTQLTARLSIGGTEVSTQPGTPSPTPVSGLDPTESRSFTFDYTVKDTDSCDLSPLASVSWSEGLNSFNQPATYNGTQIAVQKLVAPSAVTTALNPVAGSVVPIGSQIQTQTMVTNRGCVSATFSATASKTGSTISWDATSGGLTTKTIASGSVGIFYSTYTVLASDATTSGFTVSYTITGTASVGGVSSLTSTIGSNVISYTVSSTTLTPSSSTGLVIAKTANTQNARAGQEITFTITVTNNTSLPVTGVAVTDNVSSDMLVKDVKSSAGSATFQGNNVTAAIGTLNANSAATVTVTVNVISTVKGGTTLTNTATVSYTGGTSVNASVSIPVGAATASTLPSTGAENPMDNVALVILFLIVGGFLLMAVIGYLKAATSGNH
jgi:uncharacterized repeat protein (TIGR01451 family)